MAVESHKETVTNPNQAARYRPFATGNFVPSDLSQSLQYFMVLLKALGRGHYWQHLLDTDMVADMA